VTLFASGDSVTRAHLHAVVDKGYEEDSAVDSKAAEYLHISEAFEHAAEFISSTATMNFMPLTYTRLVKTPVLTTIHGFSSAKIMPIYQKYRDGYFVLHQRLRSSRRAELPGDRLQRHRSLVVPASGTRR